jgi:hypothetical protein
LLPAGSPLSPSLESHPPRAQQGAAEAPHPPRRAWPQGLRAARWAALSGLLAIVLASAGCSTLPIGAGPSRTASGREARPRPATEEVFPTVEAAALEALAAAERRARAGDRRRLQVGTIRRVGAGFSYTRPIRSRGTVGSLASMRVRVRLGADDVATYIVHPRSSRARLDALNEGPSPQQKRIVDELDPLHRPLFILTPSARIVRYGGGGSERDLQLTANESP